MGPVKSLPFGYAGSTPDGGTDRMQVRHTARCRRDGGPYWLMADNCVLPDGAHNDCDPDVCFAAQLRYMRDNGGVKVHYPYGGKKAFHGPTIKERQEKGMAECRAQGWEPRVVNPLYDRTPTSALAGTHR